MLMVSGGSDSTALAYIACELRERGALGQLAMLHVNHRLRGEDADEDAEEGADGHCQIGNLAYSAAVSMDWLDEQFAVR